jgi:hypothetical protein
MVAGSSGITIPMMGPGMAYFNIGFLYLKFLDGGIDLTEARPVIAAFLIILFLWPSSVGARKLSPRHEFFDKATLAGVKRANIVRLRLKERRVTIYARLIGVGDPTYEPRLEDFGPSLKDFVERNRYRRRAKQFVQKLLHGKTIEVWTRKYAALDSKRRLLAYLKIRGSKDRVLDVNAHIIKNGMGFVARDYVHVTYARYKKLENKAREANLGLWKGLEKRIGSSPSRGGSLLNP